MNRETYNLIENITDPAIFEQLVTDLLIVYDSKFLRLNNTGINNNGKTRKAPIDTSGVILENNKQHHYYIENTITELKSLRNKWLNEKETSKNPLGDLIKAINKVKSDKKDFPNDNFTIYLTSNRRKDDNLDKEVRKKAKDENVQVDILWQEFWVQILDNNPDGQYIRNKYFKIPQERLSLNLLNKISNNLLEAYSINLLNTIDNLEKSIERDEFFEIFDSFVNTSNKLTILAGTSGSGKSNICYQILKKIINENKYALWLKPQYLSNADCIEDAIDVVIKKYCSDSLRNFNSNLNCLYIVIDDINSTSNPQKMLKTIMSLVQKDKLYGVFDYKIICPVWLELIDLDNNDFKNTNYISIGKMSKRNAIQALRIFHTNLSDIQLDDVAYNLDYDPYLIGLFNQLENISNSELIEISKNIQFEFLKNIIEDICSINSAFLYQEYIDNLFRMSINLLKSRNFLPKISDIQEMKDVDFSCLRIIIQNKKFIREDKKGNIIFRHDRARDYLFSLALCDAFKRGNIDENIITDPYYSKIVGYALAHSDVNKEILEIVEQKNPLAIIESINYIKNINETYLEQTIWNTIEEHYIKISNINSLYNAINYALINIENNDFVLIMRNKYSQQLSGWAHYGWLLLDFKYGNLFSGAIYCEKFKSIECNYQFFNDLVNHVKLKYTNSIKDKIIELLSDFDSVYKKGILILVGCFNIYDEEICKSVSKFWHQETNKQELLLYYTWAILNSFDLENYKILNDILLEYLNVSTQKDKHGNSKLGSYIDIYRMAYSYNTHFLSDNALRALIKLVGNSSIFKKWLAWGVHCIDNIIAIEYCINYLVELNKIHHDNTFNMDYYETKPSASINKDMGAFNCFVCGRHGNELEFAQMLTGLPKDEIIKGHLVQSEIENDYENWEAMQHQELLNDFDMLLKLNDLNITEQTIKSVKLGKITNKLATPVFVNGKLKNVARYNINKIPNTPKVEYIPNSKTGDIVPFDLWESNPANTIVCEGEKDMLVARSYGMNAITLTGGSQSSLKQEYLEHFKNRNVYIVYDNDDAGRTGAKKLYKQLADICKVFITDISIVCKEDKEDVSDFFNKYNRK